MSLGTSVAGRIKQQLINKIGACASVAKCYGYDKLPTDQFPIAIVKATDMNGEFWTTTSNMRVYSYRVQILWPIGQNLKGQTDDRLQVAEENVDQVVDEIINAVDIDFTLGDYALVRFVEAADSHYGEYQADGGVYKGAEITIRIHSEFTVRTS